MTREEQFDVVLRAREAGYFGDAYKRWNDGYVPTNAEDEPTDADREFALAEVLKAEALFGERAVDRFGVFDLLLIGHHTSTWRPSFLTKLTKYLEESP